MGFASRRTSGMVNPSSTGTPSYLADGSIYSGLRRLSAGEIDNSLEIIMEDTTKPAAQNISGESIQPFDNKVTNQTPSQSLVSSLEAMAQGVSQRLLADSARRGRVIGCVNAAASDSACMRTVIVKVGRLLFRRALTALEINELLTFANSAATSGASFDAGVDTILRVMLQDPRFLYRLEESSNSPTAKFGVRMASKLSFAIWGSAPTDALLQLGESGLLDTKEKTLLAAQDMLTSPRALAQAQKFHSLWLRYKNLGVEATLLNSMQSEANAMVGKVLFTDKRAWRDLLTVTQTTITAPVGNIYGITGLSATVPSLVTMPSDRKGLLSTPALLAVASKFNDTSPTMRGKFIRENILCTPIPPPPPSVNADAPPPATNGSNCKTDRYAAHRQSVSCKGCHAMMDPIGFGLEKYDKFGKLRNFDYNTDGSSNTSCPVDGNGEIASVGAFNGPAQLADLLLSNGKMEECMIKNQLAFVSGREMAIEDTTTVANLQQKFNGGTYQQLILALVASDAFFGKP